MRVSTGDCFNRFGNNLIQDRVTQMRRRLERQKIQPDRVATIYYGLHEQQQFVAAVQEFSDRVAQLPAPPPPARKPAGSPAGRAGDSPAGRAGDSPVAPGGLSPEGGDRAAGGEKPAREET